MPGLQIFRGAVYHCLGLDEFEYWEQGALVINTTGQIEACGPWPEIKARFQREHPKVIELPEGALILPGFVDLHTHLPQLPVTGKPAESLLSWLKTFIYPAEERFGDSVYAEKVSRQFFQALLKNGTTTSAVFLTSHPAAVEKAFSIAEQMGNRVVMGLNLMDTGAPVGLCHQTQTLLQETEKLYHRWHGKDHGRLLYAWMPRFALTATPELLSGIGQLRQRYPEAYLHTHLAEQVGETNEVLQQFSGAKHYTGVYDQAGLLGRKTLMAHSIYLGEEEFQRLAQVDVSLVHCPSANFFLKSGKFKLQKVLQKNLRWGLGSDVGAGPELSLFKVMKDAQYTQSFWIPVHQLFYAATLGGARALWLEDKIGNFAVGKEADFMVVQPRQKKGLQLSLGGDIEEILSGLLYLGDDRVVTQTFIQGREVYKKGQKEDRVPSLRT